jgi:hypothetical protein
MAKISRKEFQKSSEASLETARSFVKFVDHSKKIHKYLLSEIEKLQERIKQLEPKVDISDQPPNPIPCSQEPPA